MATSTFFYNGTRVDDFDGTKGVILTTIEHDSSPMVDNMTSAVPRASGHVLTDHQTRDKIIRLTGTVIGTDKQDFENRMDALKNLFHPQEGEFKITNYADTEYTLATFENGESWSGNTGWDHTNYKIGTRGMTESISNSGATFANLDYTYELYDFDSADKIRLWVYIPDSSNVTNIETRLYNSANYIFYQWTSLSDGWNELEAAITDFTDSGGGLDIFSTQVDSIHVGGTGASGTPEVVTFDDFRIVAEDDDRLYKVSSSSELDLRRDFYNLDWTHFTLDLLCTDGYGEAGKQIFIRTDDVTDTQILLPLNLEGSGIQSVRVGFDGGTIQPSKVVFTDHFTDDFSSYSNLAEIQNVYNDTGTWAKGSELGQEHTVENTTAATSEPLAIRNLSIKNGEIIGLFYTGTGVNGLFMRSDSETSVSNAITARVSGSLVTGAGFSRSASSSNNTWYWLRLSVKDKVVRVYGRALNEDDWSLYITAPADEFNAGSCGIYAGSDSCKCAYIEVIDYDKQQSGSLEFATTESTADSIALNSTALSAETEKDFVQSKGSYPVYKGGINYASIDMPTGFLGAEEFYDMPNDLDDLETFGGATEVFSALIFDSGNNDYIRRRGTFIYVAKAKSISDRKDVVVRLETISAGDPSGTAVTDDDSNDAEVTIPQDDIKDIIAVGDTTSSTAYIPIEVVWGADIPISTSTSYAIVKKVSAAGSASYYEPTTTSSSDTLERKTKVGAGGSWAANDYGYAVLDGNIPNGATGTPWKATVKYKARYL